MAVLAPTTYVVATTWLRNAVPGPRVGDILPAVDDALRADGFLLVRPVGGTPDRYVPLSSPVFTVECWVAPSAGGAPNAPWNQAGELAAQVLAATYDLSLCRRYDLSSVGNYGPARVLTAMAVGEPHRVPNDPGGFARLDLDLQLTWRAD